MNFFHQDPIHFIFSLLGIILIAISTIYMMWRQKENKKYRPSRGLTVISVVGFGMLFGSLYPPGMWYPENMLVDVLIPTAIIILGIISVDLFVGVTGIKQKVRRIKGKDKL
jgi:hypothetical protein